MVKKWFCDICGKEVVDGIAGSERFLIQFKTDAGLVIDGLDVCMAHWNKARQALGLDTWEEEVDKATKEFEEKEGIS